MELYNYSSYSYFGHLCEVPKDVLNNLHSYYDKLQAVEPTQNLGHYKQWHVQTSKLLREDIDTTWSHWTDEDYLKPTKDFFLQFVNSMFKFRFSFLQKDRVVDYHAKHMLPRIHIPLNDSGSVFVVKDDNDVEHEYNMEYGHAHFINVTLLHKVVATKNVDRKNTFFCLASFADQKIKEKFLK